MKLTREFEHNGATVTVFRRTVRSKIQSEMLHMAFGHDEDTHQIDWLEVFSFVQLLTETSIDGDLGFKVPQIGASIEELQSGLKAFLDADEELLNQLRLAISEVNASVNDASLLPPDKVDKKKETKTGKQETIS